MTTKILLPNQCILLHSFYGVEDCCLCKANQRIAESELLIQQARQEVATEVDDFLQMHLYARPDRVNTTMGFNDWMDLKKLLSKWGQK